MCLLGIEGIISEVMILLQMNPGKVCASLGLCQLAAGEPGIASVLEKEEVHSLHADPRCTVCEMALVWAQNQLRMNRTKEEIDAYLNQVAERSHEFLGCLSDVDNSLDLVFLH